jgi:hypothetical protein
MIHIPPTPFIRRRRAIASSSVPAPAALTLVAAAYDPDEQTATLQFDRAVDIAAFDGTQITINDGEEMTQTFNGGGGASLLDPLTVRISLAVIGDSVGAGVTMTASAMSGIVASDDGGTWEGATGLGLPFP